MLEVDGNKKKDSRKWTQGTRMNYLWPAGFDGQTGHPAMKSAERHRHMWRARASLGWTGHKKR
jgi:hypothetical protein